MAAGLPKLELWTFQVALKRVRGDFHPWAKRICKWNSRHKNVHHVLYMMLSWASNYFFAPKRQQEERRDLHIKKE